VSTTDLTIDHEIMVDAPIDIVWATITTPDQIAQWFAEIPDLDLRPGGEGTFIIKDGPPEPVHAPMKVETVDPPTTFSFRWAHPDGEDPVPGRSVLVTFTLESRGDARTHLRVTEAGVESIHWNDDDKAEFAKGHNEGWPNFLNRLAALAGGGSTDGMPAGTPGTGDAEDGAPT
jgi:uncharacterized protein YndB with AHSA1/START domain